ncbi:MAG: hypothetical protein HLUCCO02_00685 [Idiomarinaceae bacterium HL-53]|nr:MAG: hypothetical protein HLUCCO02_00685 [Idiomarinaceae bacterium HL-53]
MRENTLPEQSFICSGNSIFKALGLEDDEPVFNAKNNSRSLY